MEKKKIFMVAALAILLVGALPDSFGRAEMTIPESPNPDACKDGYKGGVPCGRWYELTEIQNPVEWQYDRYNDKHQRWYGLGPKKVRVIVLRGIRFDFDKYNIRAESLPIVQKDVAELKSYKNVDITIVGHTDGKGTDAYNQVLSDRRADAVMKYFISQGVNGDRMKSVGKGESEPVAPNTNPDGSDNPEGREQNRRIEIHIQ
ncbi:MAG: OmpA family protein [Deltaproteobacteria bacterium]|nr:OmpA family protein [Deltaproteobacteria bacterium]